MDHYQKYRIYIKETGGIRNAATVEFFPQHVQMPKTSSADRLAATIEDLTHILKHPHPKTHDAIRKLSEIFHPPKSDADASPRVRETDALPRVARHAAPRVVKNRKRLPTITEEPTPHPVGTIVSKKFGKGIHRGTVTKYTEDRQWPYWIDYDNGDSEEMTHKQVKRYKCIDADHVKRFTRTSL